MVRLHRFLVDYDMAMLRALAQSRGVTLDTNRQSEAVDRLSTALLDPLSVRIALAHLSGEAHAALEALLLAGGHMRVSQFARRFGQVRPSGPGRLEREAPWKDPANASEELLYSGLVFRGFAEDPAGPGEFVFIPEDLSALLPLPHAEMAGTSVMPVPPPPSYIDGGQALVEDLFRFLVHLQTRDVRTYADGRLARRDTDDLRGRLSEAGDRRLVFLRHLASRMGFVVREEGFLRLVSNPVRNWLVGHLDEQKLALQQAWRDDPTWLDMCHVPGLVCDKEADGQPQIAARTDAVATRLAILRLLGGCAGEAWWSLPSFVAAVKKTAPDFQRPDGDYESWYLRDAATGSYLSGFESWDQVEGRFISDLLTRTLCWLGVVATGSGEAGPVFRVTEVGAELMGLMTRVRSPAPTQAITVHPDFRVEVEDPANLYARFQLERFAELQAIEPCRYRITVSSIARAAARAVSVDQVLAFLHKHSERPVPANVVGQLRLWAGRLGQVKLDEVALLTVEHERVLKDLSVLPETRALISRVLSPTSALVRARDLPRLRKELRALGYLPPETADRHGDPDGCG